MCEDEQIPGLSILFAANPSVAPHLGSGPAEALVREGLVQGLQGAGCHVDRSLDHVMMKFELSENVICDIANCILIFQLQGCEH